MDIKYTSIPGELALSETLEECSALYSKNYGVWSKHSKFQGGEKIKLSPSRIKEWLSSNNAHLYQARINGELIAYAIAVMIKVKNYGVVSWVTQLVVHKNYRNIDVAKTLLFSIWGWSNHFSWGAITANPYAVRALEKATRRRCTPARINRNRRKLHKVGKDNLPYVNESTVIDVGKDKSQINTEFFVNHSDLDEMIENASTDSVPWVLGCLDEGWEWFAFTFNDQEQLKLTKDEINKMIDASEETTKEAYSRMILDSNHKWLTHTSQEIDFIVDVCDLKEGQRVLDVGCGIGRHCNELAHRGMVAKGIDYIQELIEKAKSIAIDSSELSQSYMVGDFREINLSEKYDAAICLYDVIGSFIDDSENLKILENIAKCVNSGGKVLLSVMNYELTAYNAKHKFVFEDDPNRILELASSSIMEKTGNIFDSDHYLVDESTHVVYRKELFTHGDNLPTELIVRDKRYTINGITALCKESGLHVEWARYVGAGKWNDSLESCNQSAKEILILCSRP